ncbi:MAG: hypothetical protein ACLFU9_05500 [Candidatus Bathyarchaeia archaeon]
MDAGFVGVYRVDDASVAYADEVAEDAVAYGAFFVAGSYDGYACRIEDFI